MRLHLGLNRLNQRRLDLIALHFKRLLPHQQISQMSLHQLQREQKQILGIVLSLLSQPTQKH